MTKYLVLFFLFFSFKGNAQHNIELGGSIGGCNYVGDVGGFSDYRQATPNRKNLTNIYKANFKWNDPTFFCGAYFKYKFNKRISARTQFSFLKLAGSDVGNDNIFKLVRNLSFNTNVFELNQTIEFNFYMRTKVSRNPTISKGGKKRIDVRAYFFTGLGLLQFSPRAKFNGEMVKLRPLRTEGKKYSSLTWTVPIGIGINYAFNNKYSLGFSYSYHFTGSDYLDDVSGFYNVGYQDAANPKNAKKPEYALANRTPEIQSYDETGKNYNINLPAGYKYDKNSVRGSANRKDGYFVANASFGIILKGKNKFYRKKSKQLKNVRKIQSKKYRAKF
jgi:hypothetical protein